MTVIKFQKIHEDAVVPTKGTVDSAGYDLYAVEDIEISGNQTVAVPLGFATEIPSSIHGRIESRSGMALKGYVVLTGVIDSDYRGEWKVILRNLNTERKLFKKGERIAQVVFRSTPETSFEQVESLDKTERAAGGFGSTGVK